MKTVFGFFFIVVSTTFLLLRVTHFGKQIPAAFLTKADRRHREGKPRGRRSGARAKNTSTSTSTTSPAASKAKAAARSKRRGKTDAPLPENEQGEEVKKTEDGKEETTTVKNEAAVTRSKRRGGKTGDAGAAPLAKEDEVKKKHQDGKENTETASTDKDSSAATNKQSSMKTSSTIMKSKSSSSTKDAGSTATSSATSSSKNRPKPVIGGIDSQEMRRCAVKAGVGNHRCTATLSAKAKLAYVHIPKCGSSSMRKMMDSLMFSDAKYVQCHAVPSDYFIFTLVRDAATRYLSGYQEALIRFRGNVQYNNRVNNESEPTVIERFPFFWNAGLRNVTAIQNIMDFSVYDKNEATGVVLKNKENGLPDALQMFSQFVDSEVKRTEQNAKLAADLFKNAKDKKPITDVPAQAPFDVHLNLVSSFLQDQNLHHLGRPVVMLTQYLDFVGHLESIGSDWLLIMKELAKRWTGDADMGVNIKLLKNLQEKIEQEEKRLETGQPKLVNNRPRSKKGILSMGILSDSVREKICKIVYPDLQCIPGVQTKYCPDRSSAGGSVLSVLKKKGRRLSGLMLKKKGKWGRSRKL